MVTGVTYRYPGLLVKTATTLDVLSGGRAYFGIGAAWNEQEHRGLGVPFPPLDERFERLEEALQIALQMWSGEASPYQRQALPAGTRRSICPQALSAAAPADLDRRRRRAEDAATGGAVRRRLQPLRAHGRRRAASTSWTCCAAHCETLGRPYEQIEKTSLGAPHITRSGGDGTRRPPRPSLTCSGSPELASIRPSSACPMSAIPTSSICWRRGDSAVLEASGCGTLADAQRDTVASS